MIENEITITLNRISDLGKIEEILKRLKIQSPVFIIELEESVRINFSSDYEYYELNRAIEVEFDDYELTTEVGNGRKEIRIQFSRYQSPLSTDGWGRQLEDPLDETFYLIKKSNKKSEKLNPRIKVLFEDIEQEFFINIVRGMRKDTEEKGFLVVESFDYLSSDESKEKPVYKRLYSTVRDAYWSGFQSLTGFVNEEFQEYLKAKKKLNRKSKK